MEFFISTIRMGPGHLASNDSCNCHPENCEIELTARTLPELGRKIAEAEARQDRANRAPAKEAS
jgi:hypothetical protein